MKIINTKNPELGLRALGDQMNYRKIIFYLGNILILLGSLMIVPVFWTFYYGEDDWPHFIAAGAVTILTGLLFRGKRAYDTSEETVRIKEVILLVCLTWLTVAIFGTLPYIMTGTLNNFIDAFFESMSSFTTTGASVIPDFDELSHGVLFWRSLSHWLGGMGIIVLLVAVMSTLKIGGVNLFKTEIPGSTVQKIKPRIKDTAYILWIIYMILTAVLTLLLWYMGMPFFDALCHAFGTVATAGASTKSESLAYFDNPYIYWVIIVFMFVSGANLSLYYLCYKAKSLRILWKNAEFKLYTRIILFFVTLMTCYLILSHQKDFGYSITYSAFKVVSFITTTGFVIDDYVQWPLFSQAVLIGLMFVGGCNNSTTGSVKIGRHIIYLKHISNTLRHAILHPRAIISNKIDNKNVDMEKITTAYLFFFLYMLIVFLGTIIMSALGLDFKTAFTIVASSIGNLGIGVAQTGPFYDFASLSVFGKLFLNFLMLLGRLEIFPLLIILTPMFWKEKF